jgi:hypothetical protein
MSTYIILKENKPYKVKHYPVIVKLHNLKNEKLDIKMKLSSDSTF